MKDGRDVSVKFVEEAILTAKHIGYKRAIDIMVSLRKVNPDKIFTDSVEIIVNEVMINFKMTKAILLANKPESRWARTFCYVLFQLKLNADVNYTAKYFGRNKKTVWKDLGIFNRLDSTNKIDSQLVSRFEIIKKSIDKKLSN